MMAEDTDVVQARQLAQGNYIAQANQSGTAIVAIYEHVSPRPVEQDTIGVALQQLAELPLDALPTVGNLPVGSRMHALARNPSFVGRETELRTLAAWLKERPLASAAVTGLGGLGKTQLTTEFVYRYGRYFTGGVFWISFADASAIPTEIAACHTALGEELRLDIATLPLQEQVQLVIAAWQKELPRLLIFDNCEEEALLAEWRPPSGGCRVLINSRRGTWHPDLGVQVLPLDVLSRRESRILLGKYCSELAETEREDIAQELGDLPLALYLAGKYLQEYRGSRLGEPGAYLAALRQQTPLEHPSLVDERTTYTTGHEQNVKKTFDFSYDQMNSAREIDAVALKMLARAACFGPGEPIPHELLRASVGDLEDDRLEATVVKALQRLEALGLLVKHPRESYRIHRLLMQFVRQRSMSTDLEALRDVEQVLLDRARQLNAAGYPAPLLALQAHLREAVYVALQRRDERASDLCTELGVHLVRIGSYSQAGSYLQQALTIRQQLLGPEHPEVAMSLDNLAWLYFGQGRYEQAESLFQQSLTIRQQVLGAEHPGVATSLDNLAWLYFGQERYKQAEPLAQRALSIMQQMLGPEDPEVAWNLNILAWLYQDQGKYEQAEPLFQQVLAMRRQVLGSEHPLVAKSLSNLGVSYQDQGKYEQAESLLQQALQMRQQLLGPEHPEVATSLNNLADLYRAQGRYEQAEPLFQQALKMRQQVLGAEHPEVAWNLNTLAGLYRDQGRYEQAELLYERALTLTQEALGAEHFHVALILENAALLLHKMKRESEAIELEQRAHSIRAKQTERV